jgi:hypothetical protein
MFIKLCIIWSVYLDGAGGRQGAAGSCCSRRAGSRHPRIRPGYPSTNHASPEQKYKFIIKMATAVKNNEMIGENSARGMSFLWS